MSTAGKVLTVLILLVMIVWIVMISGVSELNSNHGKKIVEQQKQLEKLTEDVAKAEGDILAITEQARVQQDTTAREIRVLLSRISHAERRQSSTIEDLKRLQIQVAEYQIAAEKAKANLDNRAAEKAKGEDDLAKKRDEIAKAKALNAELRTELAQLQEEFKKLLAENTEALTKAAQNSGVTRPASNTRVSPSS